MRKLILFHDMPLANLSFFFSFFQLIFPFTFLNYFFFKVNRCKELLELSGGELWKFYITI